MSDRYREVLGGQRRSFPLQKKKKKIKWFSYFPLSCSHRFVNTNNYLNKILIVYIVSSEGIQGVGTVRPLSRLTLPQITPPHPMINLNVNEYEKESVVREVLLGDSGLRIK